jgi:hypothetical protein
MPGDDDSWHFVRLGNDGNIRGCARVMVHTRHTSFAEMRVASSALARHPEWGRSLRLAVESDLAMARERGMTVVEPGGWVLDETLHGTSEGISIALSTLAWGQLVGNCLGYVTATVRHRSASMLRRLGAESLYAGDDEIPSYYDDRYGCDMELLRIQTPAAYSRFENRISCLQNFLSGVPVLQSAEVNNLVLPHRRCRAEAVFQ